MRTTIKLALAIGLCLFILFFAANRMMAQDVKEDLSKPIDCRTAEGDIRVLESEKAHAAEQLVKGVMAIAPAGIALGIITGTEKEKISVASGEYNEMIDKKIAEIKKQCNIE